MKIVKSWDTVVRGAPINYCTHTHCTHTTHTHDPVHMKRKILYRYVRSYLLYASSALVYYIIIIIIYFFIVSSSISPSSRTCIILAPRYIWYTKLVWIVRPDFFVPHTHTHTHTNTTPPPTTTAAHPCKPLITRPFSSPFRAFTWVYITTIIIIISFGLNPGVFNTTYYTVIAMSSWFSFACTWAIPLTYCTVQDCSYSRN